MLKSFIPYILSQPYNRNNEKSDGINLGIPSLLFKVLFVNIYMDRYLFPLDTFLLRLE